MWGGHFGYDGGFFFFPFISWILWIAAVIYVLYLGSRLVRAVERIADRGEGRKPSS
jgi:threonine/homoserine/homoserine lactone efflux protein